MIVAAILLAAAAGTAAADRFVTVCANCHTIGGGDRDGPDLAPATRGSEADLRAAVGRMSESVAPMTPGEIAEMVAFLRSPDVAARIDEAKKKALEESGEGLEPGSAAEGRALFLGSAAFSSGGIPCSACHAYGGAGGSLAVALDGAAAKFGPAGLRNAAASPSWPAMKAVYGIRPVTKQEAAHLVAFLSGEAPAAAAPAAAGPPWVPALGVLAAATALTALSLRRRNRGVRAALVREAHRRSTR